MKIKEVKEALKGLNEIKFALPDGSFVPAHFHVTEVGVITRHFIDCGGTERLEKVVNFQLWEAGDFDHRLAPQKLNAIIELSDERLGLGNAEVEVEYQLDTIGKFDLAFNGKSFELVNKKTACLAQDKCGIPEEQLEIVSGDQNSSCTPGGGCC